jgi:outer membrane protein TolC
MAGALPRRVLRAALVASSVALAGHPAAGEEAGTPVSSQQLFLMMFVDQGRTIGYQRLLAGIHLDTVKAELDRDRAILEQNRDLYGKNAIPLIELEISQLRDAWNRKQLIVAEKNLEALEAQFSAITQIAQRYAGEPIPVEDLYAAYRRSWDAGCAKGPDEVVAMQAWAAYAAKSLERARQLNSRGSLPLSTVLEREAQLKIARSNAESREARLDRCRAVLFPSLDEVLSVGE